LLRGYSFFGILLSISVIRGSNGIIYAETPGGQRVLRLAGLGINFPTLKMLAFIAATFAAISPLEAQIGRWEFDFAASDHGFLAGFADYPSRDFDPALYDFVADRRARPANLGGAPALFIGGSNRSDDLFMFWKKRITGLPPETAVRLTMEIEFASKYAVGLVGIGGAPGESVIVKAGAVPFEPQPVIDPQSDNWWRMNLDKGNQSVGGADMTVVGHVGKPDDGTENYAALVRGQHGAALTATTAPDGSLWLVFGSDSGFEGRSELLLLTPHRLDRHRAEAGAVARTGHRCHIAHSGVEHDGATRDRRQSRQRMAAGQCDQASPRSPRRRTTTLLARGAHASGEASLTSNRPPELPVEAVPI
jgi:hypothetical protein